MRIEELSVRILIYLAVELQEVRNGASSTHFLLHILLQLLYVVEELEEVQGLAGLPDQLVITARLYDVLHQLVLGLLKHAVQG